MPKLCLQLQCWGSQMGRGTWGDPSPETPAAIPCGTAQGRRGERKLLRVGRAARCRGTGAAGQGVCILLTHSELLPVGGGKGLRQELQNSPVQVCTRCRYVQVAAEESVPGQIMIKPHQNSANIQHRLILQNAAFSY